MMEWRVVFGIVGATFVILVIGGYALNWRWTGFKGNTLWDWLELLALPVVIASLPLWFATNKRFEGRWRAVGVAGLAVFVVVVVGGYALEWGWTGFRATPCGTGCACCWSPSCCRRRSHGSRHGPSQSGSRGLACTYDGPLRENRPSISRDVVRTI